MAARRAAFDLHCRKPGFACLVVLVVAATLGGVAVTAGGAYAAVPLPSDVIAYVQIPASGPYQVVTVRPDGSARTVRFGVCSTGGGDPEISPDGTKVLFDDITSGCGGQVHLFVADLDGSNRVDLTPSGNGFLGRWSPDGTKIAYQSSQGSGHALVVADTDGGHKVTVATGVSGFAWSPDSTALAYSFGYSQCVTPAERIAVVHADGSATTVIHAPCRSVESAGVVQDWGAHGIYTFGADGGFAGVNVMAADGTGVVHLYGAGNVGQPVRLSPDGGWLLSNHEAGNSSVPQYASADGSGGWADLAVPPRTVSASWGTASAVAAGAAPTEALIFQEKVGGRIFTVRPDGTNLVFRFQACAARALPDLSPSGTRVVYESGCASTYQLSAVDLDGAHRVDLEPPNGLAHGVSRWSPTGDRVAWMAGVTGGSRELIVENADGSHMVTAASNVDGFAWSPDGTQLAYSTMASSCVGLVEQLRVVNGDGSANHAIYTPCNALQDKGSVNDWGASGILTYNNDGTLYLVAPDGSSSQAVAAQIVASTLFRFSPDARFIATAHDAADGSWLQYLPTTGLGGWVKVPVAFGATDPSWGRARLDTTPPTVTGVADRPADAAGWYRAPVTFTWSSTDPAPSSGIASQPPPVTYAGPDGADATVTSAASCDPAANCATGSATLSYDATAPTVTATETGSLGDHGWFTDPATVHFTCSDATSGVATCPADQTVTADGTATVTGAAVDNAGNTAASSVTVKVDKVAPTVAATLSQAANANGWNNAAVTVHFACGDATSGVVACPADQIVSGDGDHTVTGAARDTAGNTASTAVLVRLDGTNPTIVATTDRAANGAGWFNAAVTVRFACTDTTSGVVSCGPDDVVHGDGAAIAYRGAATDAAGNIATAAGVVAIDETPPTIIAAASGAAGSGGWYRGPATVHFACGDATSGVADCPTDRTVTADGTATVSGAAADAAGNTAVTSTTVKLDRTPPLITATADRAGNGVGWYQAPVMVHFECFDATSGVAACPADQTVTADGAVEVSASAADGAGNTATATVEINVDHTAPVITATADRAGNGAGWYQAPVTVHFSCSDATSGVAVCPADQTVTADGSVQVLGTAADAAGNTATANVTVQVDQMAPTVTATVSQAPNAHGWHNTPVTVHFSCADSTSGVGACPADQTVSGDGDHTVTATAADTAGNTAAATVTLHLDATGPAVVLTEDQSPNGAGWYNTAVTVHAACLDATSGIASCPPDQTVSADGETTVIDTATDLADNTATATLPVHLDRTPPTVTAVDDRAPNGAGWHNTAVTVHYSCADVTSGVATCPADQTVTADGLTELTGSAADHADNHTSVVTDIRVDRGAPTITAAASGATGDHGWFTGPVTVHFSCADTISGVATCPSDQTVSGDGTHSAAGTASDEAGNAASVSVTVNIDHRAPAITASASQPQNSNGWNNIPVTIHFDCADTTSGVATCPADQTVTTDGTATVTGVAADAAGNTATVTVTVSVDRSGPTIVLTPDRAANGAGWYNAAVTVHATCIDATSGVATCPADRTVSADGTVTVTGTAADRAGNAASADLVINLDRTPPTVTAAAAGTTGANGWYTGPVTVHYTCADATSGVATCPPAQSVTADGTSTINATARDNAGNTAAAAVTVKIDRSAPGGAITTPNNTVFIVGGHLGGNAVDPTSGVDRVTVTYSGSSTVTFTATLSCDTARKSCTWTAPVPIPPLLVLGSYSAAATITDQAGNTTTTSAIHFTTIV
jgi:Tol biopolymer transport system component